MVWVCAEKRTQRLGEEMYGCMKWRVPDQEVYERRLGQRLCRKTVRHLNCTERMSWIAVDEKADKG